MSLDPFSTSELLAELRKRFARSRPIGAGWASTGSPEYWPDEYIARACLHKPDAPKGLIELKREQLSLRWLAKQLEQAATTAKENDEPVQEHP